MENEKPTHLPKELIPEEVAIPDPTRPSEEHQLVTPELTKGDRVEDSSEKENRSGHLLSEKLENRVQSIEAEKDNLEHAILIMGNLLNSPSKHNEGSEPQTAERESKSLDEITHSLGALQQEAQQLITERSSLVQISELNIASLEQLDPDSPEMSGQIKQLLERSQEIEQQLITLHQRMRELTRQSHAIIAEYRIAYNNQELISAGLRPLDIATRETIHKRQTQLDEQHRKQFPSGVKGIASQLMRREEYLQSQKKRKIVSNLSLLDYKETGFEIPTNFEGYYFEYFRVDEGKLVVQVVETAANKILEHQANQLQRVRVEPASDDQHSIRNFVELAEQQVERLVREKEGTKLLENLSQFLSGFRLRHFETRRGKLNIDTLLDKSKTIKSQYDQDRQEDRTETFITNLDLAAWDNFKNDPAVMAQFGEASLESAERVLAWQLSQSILDNRGKENGNISGVKLAHFPYTETVPLTLLHAFDQRHTSELWPRTQEKAEENSTILTYCNNLTEEQINDLSKTNPPAASMAKHIRDNPETFYMPTIENPIVANFRTALLNDPEFCSKVCFGETKAFTIDQDFGLESYSRETLNRILPDLTNQEIPERIEQGTDLFAKIAMAQATIDVGGGRFVRSNKDGNYPYISRREEIQPSSSTWEIPASVYEYYRSKHGFTEEDPGEAAPRLKNPINAVIEKDFTDLALTLVRQSPQENGSVINWLQNREVALDDSHRTQLQELYTSLQDDIIRINIAHIFSERAKEKNLDDTTPSQEDLDSLLSFYTDFSSQSERMQKELSSLVPGIVGSIARSNRDPQGLELLFSSIQIDPEVGEASIQMLRSLSNDSDDYYRVKNLDEVMLRGITSFAAQEGAIQLFSDLTDNGYRFKHRDTTLLEQMIPNREAIINNLQSLRLIAPDFQYNLIGINSIDKIDPVERWLSQLAANEAMTQFSEAYYRGQVSNEFVDHFASSIVDHYNRGKDLKMPELIEQSKSNIKQLISDVLNPDGPLNELKEFYMAESVVQYVIPHPDRYVSMQSVAEMVSRPDSPLKPYFDLYTSNEILNFVTHSPANTQENVAYVGRIFASYGEGLTEAVPTINILLTAVEEQKVTSDVAEYFQADCAALLEKKAASLRKFVLDNPDRLLSTRQDAQFINQIANRYGNGAESIMKGYAACLEQGILQSSNRELVTEFLTYFRAVGPEIIRHYQQSKENNQERFYLARLNSLAERMSGAGAISDEERSEPYFKELIQHVYQNNSGTWASLESNERCSDHMDHLAQFTLQPRYVVDLFSSAAINLREGANSESINQIITQIEKPIDGYKGSDKAHDIPAINEQIEGVLDIAKPSNVLEDFDPKNLKTTEEKALYLLTEFLFGENEITSTEIKNLLIAYNFTHLGDPKTYFADRDSRIAESSNQQYAELCELHTFYQDHMKEGLRKVLAEGWSSELSTVMPSYFAAMQRKFLSQEREEAISRAQVDKLGLNDGFIKQVKRTLEKGKSKKYSTTEVERIIHRYESMTEGLVSPKSVSEKKRTQAFYGQLRAQREKSRQLTNEISTNYTAAEDFHLEDFNQEALLLATNEVDVAVHNYNEKQFSAFVEEKCAEIFREEIALTEDALERFVSESGSKREILNAFITKNKESANARMVGGVCVSGDNPTETEATANMWDMDNYFQLVLQSPDDFRCQGLSLLHHFTDEQGQKILTASLNPSSTYLFSVDESALYSGMIQVLEQFAQENNFDAIMFSRHSAIRTNRTGGTFEKAMNQQIEQINERYSFAEPKQFSYKPSYQVQEMDVIWRNPSKVTNQSQEGDQALTGNREAVPA